jgi:hypothetical protein
MTTMEQFFSVECVGGQVEPYPYYDGEKVDRDWELDRSEGLQPDVDPNARHNGYADILRALMDGTTGE